MPDTYSTKQAMADALKELLAARPFSKVSVSELCEACGMNRKSFYYHFQDKYALLNWIFYNEYVSRLRKDADTVSDWGMLNDLCRYIYDNRQFYRRAFEVEGQNSFTDYFREVIGSILTNDMARIFGQTEHVDFFTNFYLYAFVCSIRRWLQSSEVMPADTFSGLLKQCVAGVSDYVQKKYREDAL